MAKITGLGRGLDSLIPRKVIKDAIAEPHRDFLLNDNINQILNVPVDEITANPYQPRTVFDHEDLESLIESIRLHGIIQPLVVTKSKEGYELIAGERRLRASKILGLATVPVIVREAGEQEKLELALIENIQRRNLNPIEKAVAYQKLVDEYNLSQEEAADKLGVSRSSLANTLRFLDLPAEIQRSLAREEITEGHAKVIAGLSGEKEQLDFLKKILQYNFTVRDAERARQSTQTSRPRAQAKRDPEVEDKENILREKLNTKVDIKKKGGQGEIVIEFYSEEELASIINQIVN
ncbi:MAG: Stage 0 sporulation protein J [Parcubacteria group bacterium GW2011_GWC2_39_14]|nr:MAG: Stage 0 sporulation protein J [Parcubacteria group bacterium GW2011_GWC2_39_14]KKR54715.1 MAG: Stage 0 sporulation protein J [Parcubacteria group bacterium GW2011_GWA2_40_23]